MDPAAEQPDASDASFPPGDGRTIAEMAALAGGLAHELRNPLSTMMINLKLLAEDLRDTDSRQDDMRRRALLKIDGLRREAERLQSLFDEFLSLTGPCRLELKQTDLAEIVERLVEFLDPMTRSRSIALEVKRPEAPLLARVDERLIRQALLNIVVNAEEAMPDGGRVRIVLRRDGAHGEIAVSDTGRGIAAKDMDRVLTPFYSTKGTGTGLGLSITRRLIREHGGSLSFESEPGRGTTFRIRLPLDVS